MVIRSRRAAFAIFFALSTLAPACSLEVPGAPGKATGIAVTAELESTEAVAKLVLGGRAPDGSRAFTDLTVPLPSPTPAVGTPFSVGRVELIGLAGRGIPLRLEARATDGHLRGVGTATVTAVAGEDVPVTITVHEVAVCGDAIVSQPMESCDDGNTMAGDGCDARCQQEPGFVCTGAPSTCKGTCGNGVLDPGEACDDDNPNGGDGCSGGCQVEDGFSCSGAPSVCAAICGDGLVRGAEGCDDRGTRDGDGCSAACAIETGFACSGGPSICDGICGDSLVRGGETCDDGNTDPGDGCDARCRREQGYSCDTAMPSHCTRLPSSYTVESLAEQSTMSTSFVDIPGATLAFTPGDSGGTWLILVSGLLRSTTDLDGAVEARLTINGTESDLFGHTTFGTTDGWAGYTSFDLIENMGGPQRVVLQFRTAINGARAFSQKVRLVAVEVPPAADLRWVKADALMSAAGRGLPLTTLSFTPGSPGEYLVLGKVSQSQSPSGNSVDSFVEDQQTGRAHPEAPSGIHFANARGSWQPMFTIFKSTLDGRPAGFQLRGTSSARGDWFSAAYRFRRRLTVTSTLGVPNAYALSFALDHAALVGANKARADGADLALVRLAGPQWLRQDLAIDDDSGYGRPDTRLWFATKAAVPSSASDQSYYLYYGYDAALAQAQDATLVFQDWDSFGGSILDAARWNVLAGAAATQVANGILTLGPGAKIQTRHGFGGGSVFEARVQLSALAQRFFFWAASDQSDYTNNYAALYTTAVDQRAESKKNGVAAVSTPIAVRTATASHLYAIARLGGTMVRYREDGALLASHSQNLPNGNLAPLLSNQSAAGNMRYQWARVRLVQEPEPTVIVGAEEEQYGVLPSSWRYARLVAFRTDAWRSIAAAFDAPMSSTSSSTVATKSTVTATSAGSYLVIQSERIAGPATTPMQRKVGQLRSGATVLLETGHRIDRGDGLNGYHHIAGVAHVVTLGAGESRAFVNAFASPDGSAVEAADSVIVVLGLR